MVAEIDIYRSARILIDRHGSEAAEIARARIGECRAAGDSGGCEVWRRIGQAIERLSANQAGPKDSLH